MQPGKLLGTKGVSIAGIRKASGASIKLAQDLSEIINSDGVIEGVVKGDRLLTISGPCSAVLSAASDCIHKLLESQVCFNEARQLKSSTCRVCQFAMIF